MLKKLIPLLFISLSANAAPMFDGHYLFTFAGNNNFNAVGNIEVNQGIAQFSGKYISNYISTAFTSGAAITTPPDENGIVNGAFGVNNGTINYTIVLNNAGNFGYINGTVVNNNIQFTGTIQRK